MALIPVFCWTYVGFFLIYLPTSTIAGSQLMHIFNLRIKFEQFSKVIAWFAFIIIEWEFLLFQIIASPWCCHEKNNKFSYSVWMYRGISCGFKSNFLLPKIWVPELSSILNIHFCEVPWFLASHRLGGGGTGCSSHNVSAPLYVSFLSWILVPWVLVASIARQSLCTDVF